MTSFLGVSGYQWLAGLAAVQAAFFLPDSFIGHYRSGFDLRAQYLPFIVGALLILSAGAAALTPHGRVVTTVAIVAGSVAVAAGLVGAGYHHWYGIPTKPGGYRWLLHHLMHHAPPLAPLALVTAGGLEVVAALGMSGTGRLLGISLRTIALIIVSLTLIGAAAQAGLLHYRGAYHSPAMYLPVTVLPLAAAATGWTAASNPGGAADLIASSLLVVIFLTGFIGAGLHLRGTDRQMGGLYVGVAAILEAPPPGAPLFVATVGVSGLVAVRLL